ncbi:hypothetical protein MTBLM1_30066 [Rhodospirillaceae bacterium LM-1]|nr:hypothetical protein MTBLM1_30066 [Rhodospirillaceae bacterium LM-1]
MLGLAAIVFLTVAAAGSLFWFNWWIRNSWVRVYPICHDGDTLVEFTEPMTDEAFELYARYMLLDSAEYVRVINKTVYSKRWYWLFGDGEHLQITGLVADALAKAHGQKGGRDSHCREIANNGTLRDGWYHAEYYPPNWVRDNLLLISFGVRRERIGYYTPVGRFLKRFEISDNEPKP